MSRQIKNTILSGVLLLSSLLLTALVLEASARLYKQEFSFGNFLASKLDLFRAAYPTAFDARLGWIPERGEHPENVWQTFVTIDADGIRSNGQPLPAAGTVILTVGDSFTFGDQVADHETWPAMLERLTGARVLNAGVFGYGVDQSYLRMLDLAAKYQPDRIIFSFIEDDIRRSELSERNAVVKPYFAIAGDGSLRLEDSHVVYRSPAPLTLLRRVLGHSYLLHKLMMKAFPEFWLQGSLREASPHSEGDTVTCLIFAALASYSRQHDVPIALLVQYEEHWYQHEMRRLGQAVRCARGHDVLQVIDMRAALASIRERDPAQYLRLFAGHMTPAGNRLVAELLQQELPASMAAGGAVDQTHGTVD